MDQLVVASLAVGHPISLTIYSRPGCRLCDEMRAVVERVARLVPLTPLEVVEIDISQDAELDERYRLEIPVLLVNGKKAAKYRITEEELTRILMARAGTAGEAEKAGGAGKAGGAEPVPPISPSR